MTSAGDGSSDPGERSAEGEISPPWGRPAPPPSELIRTAQSRLLARLAAESVPEPAPKIEAAEARYDVGEPFAVGGFGVIWRAWDRRLGREVGIKAPRRADPGAERRFLLEAAITARLQHPAIVPLYDAGRFPSGEPYYCMKLVDGRSLEQVIGTTTSLRERLLLLEHVRAAADAIAYAHTRGVIHRDLKPSNILVGPHGETVVIDWGLAKDMTGEIADEALVPLGPTEAAATTEVGEVVGTPCYMPPEQAAGGTVDARSDVFALGAVLFHVLAGRPPHDRIGRAELIERLRAGDLAPGTLPAEVPAEVASIVRKAMSVRPDDRYAGADALAADLRRFLAGRLVGAHRYRAGDLLRLLFRHYRVVSIVGALALALLAVVSLVFVARIRGERDAAQAARADAEAAESQARRQAEDAVLAQARATLHVDVHAALRLLREIDLSEEASRRRARLVALEAAARGAPDRVLAGPERPIESIAGVAGGGVVGVDAGGEIWRWDDGTGEGERVATLSGPSGQVVAAAEAPVWAALVGRRGLVFRGDEPPEAIELDPLDVSIPRRMYAEHRWQLSRHGETLAALGTERFWMSQKLAGAYVWDLIARPAFRHVAPIGHIGSAALAPDGAVLALADAERRTLLLAGEVKTPVPEVARPRGFTRDGRYLLADMRDRRGLAVYSLADGTVRELGGTFLAVTSDDDVLVHETNPHLLPLAHRPRLALRSIATGVDRWTAELDGSKALTHALSSGEGTFAVDPNGERFALQVDDVWQIWSMRSGTITREIATGHHVPGVFLTDGRFALARGDEIWVWSFAEPVVELCAAVALASDASHAILGGEVGPGLRLWRSADRRELAVTCLRDFALSEFGAQGRGQVKVDRRGRVLTTDIHGRACFARSDGESEWLDVPAMATAVALAEEGEAFAVGFDDGGLVVWDRPGGEVRRWQFDTAIAELWLVGAGTAAIVLTRAEQVWAVRAGEEEPARLAGVPGATTITPLRVASQPKGAGAALALAAEEALISYDAGTGAVTRFPVLLARPGAIAYSASGARIAAAFAGEGVVVLPGTLDGPGIEVATREEVRGLAFVDEDELAALGESGALLRIDLALGECAPIQRRFDAQRADPATLVALPSGQSYALASGMLRISPVDPVPRDAAGLQAWIELRTRTDP